MYRIDVELPKSRISLEDQLRYITFEANIAERFQKVIPTDKFTTFISDVKGRVDQLLGSFTQFTPTHFKLSNVERTLKDFPYSEMKDIVIFRPVGMTCTYPDLMEVLQKHQYIVKELLTDVITPYHRWIGSLLNDPQQLQKLPNKDQFTFHDIVSAKKDYGECFSNSDKGDTVKYGDVVKRHRDWIEVIEILQDLNRHYNESTVEAVTKATRELEDSTMLLVERIEESQEDHRVSGPAIQLISELSLQIAQEIEFYGLHGYVLLSTNKAVKDTEKKIEHITQ